MNLPLLSTPFKLHTPIHSQVCSYLVNEQKTNSSKPEWQILADLASQQLGGECLTVDWQGTLDYLKDPEKAKRGGLRSWEWQTCTEFGFYQTCEEDSGCPYGKGYHTLQQDFQVCDVAFGISEEEVRESIEQTKEYYGANKLLEGGSRILSVNGNVDPVRKVSELCRAYCVFTMLLMEQFLIWRTYYTQTIMKWATLAR